MQQSLRESDLYLMAGAMPPEFRPRKDRPAWTMTLPLDWAADPFGDKNWRFHLHAWRMLDPLIKQWFRRPRARLLSDAWAYACDWWQFHQSGGASDVSWYDMAAGIRAFKLALLLERVRKGDLELTEQAKGDLLAMVDAHAEFLRVSEHVPSHNHGIFMAAGLRQMCRQVPDRPSCQSGEERSAEYMRRIIAHEFTDEGIHREHSPGYHFFVTQALHKIGAAELFHEVENLRAMIERAQANSPWMVFPNREVSRIGDNRYEGEPLRETASKAVIGGREYAIGDFTRSGYAIVRTFGEVPVERQSMLFFTGMSYGWDHKHADDLSFELFEAGQRILIDSGSYDFEWDAMRRYVYSAAAHNTVDLVDRPITHKDRHPYGSGLSPIRVEGEEFVLAGQVRRAGTFDQARTLRYRPGAWLVIEDDLAADKRLSYVSRLHFSHRLSVVKEKRTYLVIDPSGLVLATVTPPPRSKVRLVRGQDDPLLGWETVARREMAPTFVLEASRRGRKLSMTWHITLLARH